MNEQVKWGVIANGVVLIVSTLLIIFLTHFGVAKDLSAVISGLLLLIGTVVIWRVQLSVGQWRKKIGLQFMGEKMGLVEVYDNLNKAGKDMLVDFKKARISKLLLQLGRFEYTGKLSLLYQATKNKTDNGVSIKILHASSESQCISKEKAESKGKKYLEWQKGVQHLRDCFSILRDNFYVNIEVREHCEPFFWKIYIFDDIAYFSPYLFDTKNNDLAPVYKYKSGEQSFYKSLDKYFDELWDYYVTKKEKLS